MATASEIKALVETAASAEKFRIGISNRISALERGVDEAESPAESIYRTLYERAEGMEELIDKAMRASVVGHPAYDTWLCHVKGIGPTLAAQMLAFLLPPKPQYGVGTWFKAAGLAPEWRKEQDTFRLPRARKGEGKVQHHRYLRRCLYNVATSLVRVGGFYREYYEHAKARLLRAHEGEDGWPLIRIDRVARWVTVKLLLSHLWAKWAEAEGISVRPPYVVTVLGHDGYIPPPEWSGDGKI